MDRLNNLSTKYPAIDYEEWFDAMDIPREDKEKRIELAEKIDDVYDWLFNFVAMMLLLDEAIDTEYLILSVRYRLFDLVDVDVDYAASHLTKVATETVQATIDHIDDDYFLSPQRSSEIAADEAHTIATYEEMSEAWENGNTKKTWHTQHDRRVRKTHVAVDGKTIPMKDLFVVGGSKMLCPHDTENGAELKEVAGCRCFLTYS